MPRTRQTSKNTCCVDTHAGVVSYQLIRSNRRRTIAIHIEEDAQVNVFAPYYAKNKDVINFIQEKSLWIASRLKQAQNRISRLEAIKYESGGIYLFLGKKFLLIVERMPLKPQNLVFDEHRWLINLPIALSVTQEHEIVREQMALWYEKQAKEVLEGRVRHYSQLMNVYPRKINVKRQKRIWGSCHFSTQTVSFNWQIILSPLSVIDYIVVHELCHLTVPDHSKRFWNRVEQFYPSYKEQKKWLKLNYYDMQLP